MVELARQAIRHYLEVGKILEIPDPLPPVFDRQAGVFVCLYQEKKLRGCVGTPVPLSPSLAKETVRNSVGAATKDPRFPPLSLEELEGLCISVDVLSPLKSAPSEAHWDVRRYGVLVDQELRRGILLPGVEGVATAQEQVEIACRKAGIDPKSSFRVQLFQVERFGEEAGS